MNAKCDGTINDAMAICLTGPFPSEKRGMIINLQENQVSGFYAKGGQFQYDMGDYDTPALGSVFYYNSEILLQCTIPGLEQPFMNVRDKLDNLVSGATSRASQIASNDADILALQNYDIANNDATNATQTADILTNANATDTVEIVNTVQDQRLTSIEATDLTQTNTINSVISVNNSQNTRLTNIETVNTTQDGRLTAIEGSNTTQTANILANTNDIIAIESVNVTQTANILTNTTAVSDIHSRFICGTIDSLTEITADTWTNEGLFTSTNNNSFCSKNLFSIYKILLSSNPNFDISILTSTMIFSPCLE
jgi:hypothetical protein